MEFGWDEDKNRRNIVRHGLPLSSAERLFQGPRLERIDDREDYGELRIEAFGLIQGRVFVCIYNDRVVDDVEVRWVISFRKADARETRNYYERIQTEGIWQTRS